MPNGIHEGSDSTAVFAVWGVAAPRRGPAKYHSEWTLSFSHFCDLYIEYNLPIQQNPYDGFTAMHC